MAHPRWLVVLAFVVAAFAFAPQAKAQAPAGPCQVAGIDGNPFNITCPGGVAVGSVGFQIPGILFGVPVGIGYNFGGAVFPNNCCALFFGPVPPGLFGGSGGGAGGVATTPDVADLPGGDVQFLTGFSPLFDTLASQLPADNQPAGPPVELAGPEIPPGADLIRVPLDGDRVLVMIVPQAQVEVGEALDDGLDELEAATSSTGDPNLELSLLRTLGGAGRKNEDLEGTRANVMINAFFFVSEPSVFKNGIGIGGGRIHIPDDAELGDGDIIF
jgi:hypothetical protein